MCDEAGAHYALKYVTKGGDMSKKGMGAIDHLTRKNDCSMPMKSICRSAAVKANTRDIGPCESAMLIDSSIKFLKNTINNALKTRIVIVRWMKSNAIALPNKITDLKEDVFKSTSEMDAYLQRPQYYGDDVVHKHDLWKVSFYSWYKIFEKDKELGWVKYARLALVHMKPSIKKFHRQQVVRQ